MQKMEHRELIAKSGETIGSSWPEIWLVKPIVKKNGLFYAKNIPDKTTRMRVRYP